MINKNVLNELLKKIYYSSPEIICIGLVVGTIIHIGWYEVIKKWKNGKYMYFLYDIEVIFSIGIIFIITLLSRERQAIHSGSLIPFSNLYSLNKIRGNIMNIILFYPLGILAGTRWNKKRTVLLGILLSIGIEIIQYWWKLGYAEIDDIINNSIGMSAGVCIMLGYKNWIGRK